ncbi:Axonemal dynein light chain domain-containing protein 1 [Clydaea vesicula]|uniref:Axonemal dynein light chain domain-containing protein 1 n=1 Tax=Clydaea vesicula TaxID=447962 RepID=A0AAD5TU83_9FUNG|nr:Axonemal dynein light chain domain-containing protein 1 [Clydaea vesicula]
MSLKPTNRKEVAILKHTMVALLQELGAEDEQDYPTDMHAFLSVIQEEQKIYDTVFEEIIRQVTVNMVERGDILSEIRNRYSHLFIKIPKHVRHLHTELVAQRKLNKRLTEELVRAKDTVCELHKEVEVIRKHDIEVAKQAQDTQEKLVSILTQSDNTDEILEEYHKLYKMQRDRLEEAVTITESEKRMWIDAATKLVMRIGHESGINELLQLHRFEQARLRSSNHMIEIIRSSNDSELHLIEKKSQDSILKLMQISRAVVDEDQLNIETITKMEKDIRLILKSLDCETTYESEAEKRLLDRFNLYDVKALSEHLFKWVEHITLVAQRFTSDKDLSVQEDLINIRGMMETWVEAGLKLLQKNEKTTNGKDYKVLTEALNSCNAEIDLWLRKVEMRVSGEDGIASHVISLQNQLEDRYTTYSARDFDKPLPASERVQLKDAFTNWIEQTTLLISTLTNTTEREQQRVPMHLENWLNRILDQINTDTDVRNEENVKVHNSMTSWMVQLLVKGAEELPSDQWDQEFHQLNQELISFNLNLLRDSGDLEMISDDKSDLRKQMLGHSDKWLTIAKRLLINEKKLVQKVLDEKKKVKVIKFNAADDIILPEDTSNLTAIGGASLSRNSSAVLTPDPNLGNEATKTSLIEIKEGEEDN